MLLLISLLILVHELGHFLAAKFVGIRVDKFGFGLPFGPTLFTNNKIVYLWVYKDNVKAISLYKRLGFLIINETKNRYYMKYI